MADHPLTAVRKDQLGVRREKRLEFRLDRLGDQMARASAQDFRERILNFVFLAIGNNIMIGQGVTLLWRIGQVWSPTPLRRLPHIVTHFPA